MTRLGGLLLRKKTSRKFISGLLLLSFIFGNFVTPFTAHAAQVAIDSTVGAAATHTILGSATVFTTDQIGYRFYVDSSGICVYSKTTNGGTSWGTAVTIDSDLNCFGMSVWYDKWTPGDNGDYIHIMTTETADDDLWYNRLDTTNDERLMGIVPVSTVVNTGQSGTISAGANVGSITKGTDGTIYMVMNDNSDSYVVECSSNCGAAASWTETGVNPMDNANPADYSMLMPLPNGDILLINRDISADDMRSKVWSNSGGSWSGAWTTIDANALENATYDPQFSAAVNPITGAVYLAYVDNATTGTVGGTNDDIRVWTYSGGTWTAGGDVLTNSTLGVVDVNLGVNGNTGAVYAAYVARTTPGTNTTARVYWKQSTNGMVSWGTQQGPVDTLGATEKFGLSLNLVNYQRMHVSWHNNGTVLYGDTIADLTPTTEVSSRGIQETEVSASTTNLYVGGAFVIDENVTSRNVTSITVTETGTINAATNLRNIELWYDLDTTAPYDCASESYSNGATQFGSTDANGFSTANGTSTFTGSVGISTTQSMCVYTVVDVAKTASQGNTIEVEIDDPRSDVVLSGGVTAVPDYSVAIDGETTVKLNSDFRVQRGYVNLTGDSVTITAGTDYDAPVSSSSAFIRITNTGHTGAGRDTGGGTSNADDVTAYITNPENITNSITFQRGSGAADSTRIAWEIIEYRGIAGGDNEMIVRRHQPLTYVAGNTTVTSSAVPGIATDGDVAVFITSQFNPSTAATVYHQGVSTAAWNAGGDTVTLTRGASGVAAIASYAVVEFTGSNWKVQRAEHVYSAVGTTQTEAITAVNSLSRTFLHVQKRLPSSTHANFGHEVWLSGIGQVSFLLDSAAATPASHVSVAWVIENTQTNGTPMDVTRSNGTLGTTGTAPQTNIINIGATMSDLSVTSIFTNNKSNTNTNTWPEPILGVRLLSTTQYEIWRSDIGATVTYRTEVVEWPTAERRLTQNYYRLYADNGAITPTDPWPPGGTNLGENTEMTASDDPLVPGEDLRIRMSVRVTGAALPANTDSYQLQFGRRVTTCSAISTWLPIGDPSSTTAMWRGVNNAPADDTVLSGDPATAGDLLLSVSDMAGSYEEQNNTLLNQYMTFPNEDVEYDWVLQHNNATDKSSFCFRMVESDGTVFHSYANYPVVRTVGFEPLITNWRWYDDENNATPATPRGNENVSPSNIENQNALKLRVVVEEASGATGQNVKFALQYSEYADFSQGVHTLVSTSSCTANSIWCYYNGAGTDNSVISSSVISNADACSGGVGNGCGTYNEGTSAVNATFDQIPLAKTEYEFTVLHAGARVNRVYYFRLYNLTEDEVVGLKSGHSYPSLVTEGAALTFGISGVLAGTDIAGITTDFSTSPGAVGFDQLAINTDAEVAQQISVNTNATQGYQLLMYSRQDMLNSYGDALPNVAATNASPAGWNTACNLGVATGCFGYHTTDATLQGGSSRFAATDSYAAFEGTAREIMYSSIPVNDTGHLIYRARVGAEQPAGDYVSDIVYIAVPVH